MTRMFAGNYTPTVKRHSANPVVSPGDVPPVFPGYEILGAFNPGAFWYNGEYLLLLRVAERPVQEDGWLSLAVLDHESGSGEYRILRVKTNDPALNAFDKRVVIYQGRMYATSISHLRLARSTDGFSFTIDTDPTLMPGGFEDAYGLEDPRITPIDGEFLVNYTACSPAGYTTALRRTRDWKQFEDMGSIFHPLNKDVGIFPEKIGGQYWALHRPDSGDFEKPSMWTAVSPDLRHWGGHRFLMSPRKSGWDSMRIGAGSPPIRTDEGWLCLYHGMSDDGFTYSMGGVLLDLENPTKLLARSEQPLIKPESSEELEGFMKCAIFSNGHIVRPDQPDSLLLYYGAADTCVSVAEFSLNEIMNSLLG